MNEECKAPRNADYDNNVTANNESISTAHRLILPYKGEQRQNIIQSLNNYVKDNYHKIMRSSCSCSG